MAHAHDPIEAGPLSPLDDPALSATNVPIIPAAPVPRGGLPGPGLPEAVGWTVGVVAAHVAATIAVLLFVIFLKVATGDATSFASNLDHMPTAFVLLLVGGDQLLVLLGTMLAVSFRYAGRAARVLNLSALHPLHAAMVAGLVLPVNSLSIEVYRLADVAWKQLTEQWPLLATIDGANTVEWLSDVSSVAPLPVMLLIIAVCPALAEELVFRGVIGRGLIARWGLPAGVLMTSCLFAAVHMHPVHVLAVIPLGIAMHLVYLATRSFWAPVLLHFLNNSWATVISRVSTVPSAETVELAGGASPSLLLASVVAVIVLGAALYHTRTRYLMVDGVEWTPGYATAEAPPEGIDVLVSRGLSTHRFLATAATAWLAFAVALAAEITAFAR